MAKTKKVKLADPVRESMKTNSEYTNRSLDEALKKAREIDREPLNARQEARQAFYEAMAEDPSLVAERIGWLIDGNYGYGEMLKAKQIVASPRMNRRAALTHMIGLYEWQCPGNFAVEGWKKLTAQQKSTLDAAVDVVIEAAEAEMAAEQGS
jgi:hypothetical protein